MTGDLTCGLACDFGLMAQAAGVLATVKRDALERQGKSWSAEEEAAFKAPILAK